MPTPLMGAEDFSYVLQKTPGAMAVPGRVPGGQRLAAAPAPATPTAWCSNEAMLRAASPCTAPWPSAFSRVDSSKLPALNYSSRLGLRRF